MEKSPRSTLENKENNKESWAWRTLRNVTLSGMLGVGVASGGEYIQELMMPQLDKAKVTDNTIGREQNPDGTLKQYVTIRSGDKVYRTEIDSGIKFRDLKGWSQNTAAGERIFGHFDSVLTSVENKNGEQTAVKLKAIPEGIQITYQHLDSHGKVLSEEHSYLTPEIPNVFEQK